MAAILFVEKLEKDCVDLTKARYAGRGFVEKDGAQAHPHRIVRAIDRRINHGRLAGNFHARIGSDDAIDATLVVPPEVAVGEGARLQPLCTLSVVSVACC